MKETALDEHQQKQSEMAGAVEVIDPEIKETEKTNQEMEDIGFDEHQQMNKRKLEVQRDQTKKLKKQVCINTNGRTEMVEAIEIIDQEIKDMLV